MGTGYTYAIAVDYGGEGAWFALVHTLSSIEQEVVGDALTAGVVVGVPTQHTCIVTSYKN